MNRILLTISLLVLLFAVSCKQGWEKPTADAPASSPSSTASAGSDLDQAGVPLYPGAKVDAIASSPSQGEDHFSAQLSAQDPVDKVVKFYADKLKFESRTENGVTQLIGRTAQGADVLLFVQPDQSATKITIRGILYKKK